MNDRLSPAEQYRRQKLRQGRSPDAQLTRYQEKGRELNAKANRAVREQLRLQIRQRSVRVKR